MARILVVDDNRDIAESLIMFLEYKGHAVQYAADGRAGIRAISEKIPDLIFLDIEMPLMTGPEMAYQLFIDDCGKEKIPIFLISAADYLPDTARWIGTPYYIAKPFSIDELDELITHALRERKPPSGQMTFKQAG